MPLERFTLGDYAPDLGELDNPGLVEADGCFARDGGYIPMPDLAAAGWLRTSVVMLAAISGRLQNGENFNIAGSTTALYEAVTTSSTMNDVSRVLAYSLGVEDTWNFTRYREKVYAASFVHPVQVRNLGDAAGMFTDMTANAPRAKVAAVIKNQLFLGYTQDPIDDVTPNRIWWSALGDPEDWPTPGTADASSKLSDFEDLHAPSGAVTGLADAGDYGIAFQERAVNRLDFEGGEVFWRITPIERSRGCTAVNSIVAQGRRVYFYGPDGFMATDGLSVVPIGANKINRTVIEEIDRNYLHRMTAAVDPRNPIIYWSYASTSATNGFPDRIITYNWQEDRWTRTTTTDLAALTTMGTMAVSIDSIATPPDSLGGSLDDPQYLGGRLYVGGYGTSGIASSFSGAAYLGTTITTGLLSFRPGARHHVKRVRPLSKNPTSGTGVTAVAVRTRANAGAATVETTGYTEEIDNQFKVRNTGQFVGVSLNITQLVNPIREIEVEYEVGGVR